MRRLRRVLWLLAVALLLLWLFLPARGPEVPKGSVLVLDLDGGWAEAAEPSLLRKALGDRRRPFVSLLSELEKARRDERLAAVVLRIRGLEVDWAMAQELRDAIRALREAGRGTLAYLETSGLGANKEYYVATAAERVVASPGTQSPLVGLAMQFLFLGGLWEKLGAGVETVGTGEYKSAAETLAGTKMSAPHREMATALLDSTFEQFVAGIAEGRGLALERVRELVDEAPVRPEELRDLRLVDDVLSFDEALESLGAGREVVEAEDYARVDPAQVGFDPVARFALVYGSGMVVMGDGSSSPTGELLLTSDGVSEALEEAASDPAIRAIVFRVDSPGGSPLASDIVWRAAQQARASGKPLVASVSNVAASGGYYVLAGADAVVASPASLVGSIGVFAVRPVIGGLLEKLGIGVETLTRGEHADILLFSRPLDAAGRARLRAETDALYELFVARVAEGRGMTPEEVDAVGRGRVWTGAQAHERGLVDELGGLRVAVRRAKLEAGLEADADVALVPFPAPRSLSQQVAEALRQVSLQAAPLPLPGALRRLAALVQSAPLGGPLFLPPFFVEIR
jgi:protease-4